MAITPKSKRDLVLCGSGVLLCVLLPLVAWLRHLGVGGRHAQLLFELDAGFLLLGFFIWVKIGWRVWKSYMSGEED